MPFQLNLSFRLPFTWERTIDLKPRNGSEDMALCKYRQLSLIKRLDKTNGLCDKWYRNLNNDLTAKDENVYEIKTKNWRQEIH